MFSILIGLLSSLSAGGTTSAPAGAPVAASSPAVVVGLPAGGGIPGFSGEIQQVVERGLQQYAKAQSYADTVVVSNELDIEGRPGLEMPAPTERKLAFVRPNRLYLESQLYTVVCDGRKVYEQVGPWMQYGESDAPAQLRSANLSLSRFGFFNGFRHPLAGFLLDPDKPSLALFGKITRFTAIKAETLDGASGKRVYASVIQPSLSTSEVDLQAWFDDKSGLIGEIVYDETKLAQAGIGRTPGVTVKKFLQRLRFKDIKLNEKLDDSRFAFKPDAYAEKVASLQMPTGPELQQRMIGKLAVDFTGKDLDGKAVALADFKGRVLLLDFWSKGCGPCVRSIPTLQKAADKYASKPVSIVGVNLDGPAATEVVRSLFASQGGKFRQIIQTQPRLGEKYFVEGIPCMVMIDRKGIIRNVHLGMIAESELSGLIDKLLEGKD